MRRRNIYRRENRAVEQPTAPSDVLKTFLLNPTIILAVFTAVIYFHGQSFYSGYLSYWGLNTHLFPLSFEDTLTQGSWAYILVGIDKWRFLVGPALYVFLIYGLVFLLLFKKPANAINRLIQTERINGGQKLLLGEVTDRLVHLIIVAVVVFLIFAISIFSAQKGKSLAEAEHKKIHDTASSAQSFKTVTAKYLNEDNLVATVTGSIIESSATLFALHTEGDDLLLVPIARLISVRYHGEKLSKDKK